ncbi:MAG: hypothetical protein CMP51_04650 [Flavobacteriales bacterium]|nr:hypothetical protein [Flavobacteriales bacterium]|tara:strand:+ start:523 stop:954 length:432 start_codon:yes stop_codon:yes gene_type:complete
MIKYKYIILFFTLVLMSCSKEEESIFNIVLIETNPTEMQEFQENITVNISYEHSEGFMGFYDPDYLSLEVKDSRLTNPDFYHLIPLNPPNNQLSIQGIISLEIDSPFLLGNGNQETLYYSIRIQDREGNWSNNINTPLIYVNK